MSKAEIIQLARRGRKMMQKKQSVDIKLNLKWQTLIKNAIRRGYSPVAIDKLVKSAEGSQR